MLECLTGNRIESVGTVVSQKAVRIKGTNVNVSKQVAELLYYIETKQVCNEFTKRLDSDVAEARQNREWMVEYMIKGFAIDEEAAAVGALEKVLNIG